MSLIIRSKVIFVFYTLVKLQGYTGILNLIEYFRGYIPVLLYNNQVTTIAFMIPTPVVKCSGLSSWSFGQFLENESDINIGTRFILLFEL